MNRRQLLTGISAAFALAFGGVSLAQAQTVTIGVSAAIRFHDQNPHSGIDAFGMNKHYLAAPGHG